MNPDSDRIEQCDFVAVAKNLTGDKNLTVSVSLHGNHETYEMMILKQLGWLPVPLELVKCYSAENFVHCICISAAWMFWSYVGQASRELIVWTASCGSFRIICALDNTK